MYEIIETAILAALAVAAGNRLVAVHLEDEDRPAWVEVPAGYAPTEVTAEDLRHDPALREVPEGEVWAAVEAHDYAKVATLEARYG